MFKAAASIALLVRTSIHSAWRGLGSGRFPARIGELGAPRSKIRAPNIQDITVGYQRRQEQHVRGPRGDSCLPMRRLRHGPYAAESTVLSTKSIAAGLRLGHDTVHEYGSTRLLAIGSHPYAIGRAAQLARAGNLGTRMADMRQGLSSALLLSHEPSCTDSLGP